MRNRSATVAGFHGLPWYPKVSKERPLLTGTADKLKKISYQRIKICRYVTCHGPIQLFYVVGGVSSPRDNLSAG
jgi:hypothetical protein